MIAAPDTTRLQSARLRQAVATVWAALPPAVRATLQSRGGVAFYDLSWPGHQEHAWGSAGDREVWLNPALAQASERLRLHVIAHEYAHVWLKHPELVRRMTWRAAKAVEDYYEGLANDCAKAWGYPWSGALPRPGDGR